MTKTIEKLSQLILDRNKIEITRDDNFVHASVLMILKQDDMGFSLLFIKRPESEGDPFSGHMAFPGGRMEGIDNNKLDTAVRETKEEVGIDIINSGEVLGALDDVNPNNPRARKYVVTPFLSILNEEVKIIPDSREVEKTVWVPMRHLVDDRNKEIRIRERNGREVEDYAYNYEEYLIWGMTGRILHQFLAFSAHLF